jgi:hypothetical protein
VAALATGCATGGGAERAGWKPPASGSPEPPKLVVLVTVAGMTPADVTPGPSATMPHVAALAASGVVADHVETVLPATPLPVHAALATGELPAKNEVTGEYAIGDHGLAVPAPADYGSPAGPTLWSVLGARGERVAALGWPGTDPEAAQLFANFPAPVPWAGDTWPRQLASRTSPALLASAQRLGADALPVAFDGPARDAAIVGLACELIRAPVRPRLLLVRLSGSLPPLLAEGPQSPAARAALTAIDGEIGRLVTCVSDAGLAAQTAFVVAGDAPVGSLHTVIEPNVALADAGLLVPNPKGGLSLVRWSAFARTNGGSALVYARTEDDALLARRALEDAAAATHAFHVLSADELYRHGADPEAWFGLEAAPGYGFGPASSGPLLHFAAEKGAAGYLAPPGGLGAGFVAAGAGVRSGVRIPTMRQIDVAPTVAALLGVTLGETEGRAIVGALAFGVVPPLLLEKQGEGAGGTRDAQ